MSSASSALTKNQKKKLKRKQKQLKATKTEDLGDVLEEPAPSPEGAAPAAAAACPPGAPPDIPRFCRAAVGTTSRFVKLCKVKGFWVHVLHPKLMPHLDRDVECTSESVRS